MNKEIQFLDEEHKVIVSSEILEKIKYLAKHGVISCLYKEISNEINIDQFYKIMSNIMKSHIYLINKDNPIKYDTSLIYSLSQHLEQLRIQYNGQVRKMNEANFNDLINTVYNVKLEEKNFNLMFDLLNAKNDCLTNMKYFVSPNDISKFNEEYDNAIYIRDIKKMKDMLDLVQQAILKEWDNYFGKIDSMTDDNFAFIGHSVRSYEFNKNFYSRYVSTSLFTQDLTDTYMCGYGFILAPKNIVGASSHDMYVNNDAEDSELLIRSSIIKPIDHPKKIIDECLNLKKQNIESGNPKRVYSEVVIDGFEPVGIFCFTDGSKSLNLNYQSAKKLQEKFPNLMIYSFDIMKRKKGTELDEIKLSLINRLRKEFNPLCTEFDATSLSMYDYFFEEYEKLKQRNNFDEEEIKIIFNKNIKLLDSFYKEPNNLFDGRYTQNEIKYILGKNYEYNIDSILSGKASTYKLNNLKKLYPYKDRVNSLYDGLSEFVDLVYRVTVTDEVIPDINNTKLLNFYTIVNIITSKKLDSLNSKEIQSRQELNNYQQQYDLLNKEIEERENLEKKHEYYNSIYMNRFFSKKIKEDYVELINDIGYNEHKLKDLQSKLKEITESIEELENLIDEDKINKNNSNTKKFSLLELFKHSIFYKLKRKKEKNALILKKNSLETKRDIIELDLNYTQSEQQNLHNQVSIIKTNLNNYFKCNSIEEIDIAISKAEEFIKQYDNSNLHILLNLKIKLEELNNTILNQQNNLEELLNEKEMISKKM